MIRKLNSQLAKTIDILYSGIEDPRVMLSTFVQELRKKRGLSQEHMASALRMSRPTYVQFEKGQRELTISEAEAVAAILGISFEDLVAQRVDVETKVTIRKSKTSKSTERSKIRISVPEKKVDKFRQVLLHILKKVGGKPNVGMTVLCKLLYFIDFDYYEKYEEQLMGLEYLKNHHGPTPLLFENLVKEMVKKEEIEVVKSNFYKYPQTKYLINPAIEPDLTVLNGREQEHIDWELQRLSDMTALALSDLSHKDVPWISAQNGMSLDYESVFYRTADTSVRDYGIDDD